MSISLQDPPGHVRPYACGRRLTWYKARLTAAKIACAAMTIMVLTTGRSEYRATGSVTFDSVVEIVFWATIGNVMLYAVIVNPSATLGGNGDLIWMPKEILLLSRTPIGWALLREGVRISERRSEIENGERSLAAFRRLAIALDPQQILELEASLLAAWNKTLFDEEDLLSRQGKHLAGEVVAYDASLAASP